MDYVVGDAVHVAGLGTGTVREVLNNGRFRVEVKARVLIATRAQLTPAGQPRRSRTVRHDSTATDPVASQSSEPLTALRSLDLHGRTVLEATQDVQAFLNEALLVGDAAVRIIHGQSGGRVKAAVHAQLKRMPVRSFALDPGNPGVTVVIL